MTTQRRVTGTEFLRMTPRERANTLAGQLPLNRANTLLEVAMGLPTTPDRDSIKVLAAMSPINRGVVLDNVPAKMREDYDAFVKTRPTMRVSLADAHFISMGQGRREQRRLDDSDENPH
ncbi:hypothetical protein HZC07_00110 [Candidatus Micrarchaeota archaeon]|nr:hypothetical protein [Candidatus Micrarchaeota archaeon]